MKPRLVAVIASLSLLGASSVQASAKSAAKVTAAKGPVRITLQLDKTTAKVGKSLWYKLELKNIGKTKIRVEDRIFNDPWAMHQNCTDRHGIYLEIIRPNGKPLWVQRGGRQVTWDYASKVGDRAILTPEESKDFEAMRADGKKRGLTEQQQSIALSRWNDKYHNKKQLAELADPSKQLWLKPGASTTTFAWAYRELSPDEFTDHSDEEPQIGDYTQLWSYRFPSPGTYLIRAVYDHAHPETNEENLDKYGFPLERWWVKFNTPFIKVEVK